MHNPLRYYRILIIDADAEMAQVLKTMLKEMGFSDSHIAQDGKDAVKMMQTMHFDFIIMEWNIPQLDGIALLEFIRKNPRSPNPTIPIIMLTGRAEKTDVSTARNYGVNEYAIKPFTAQSIYNRLERIIEHPRSFVVAKEFVGPDRRAKDIKIEENQERRTRKNSPKIKPAEVIKAIHANRDIPKIWFPDFSLKLKLGKSVKLDDLITPEVLERAQSSINAITSNSLQWVKNDIDSLNQLYKILITDSPPQSIATDIGNIALSINSRAGTFGYNRTAEIAYSLYLFTFNKFDPQNTNHHIIIQKHLQTFQVMLGNQMNGDAGVIGIQIANDLTALINKYTS